MKCAFCGQRVAVGEKVGRGDECPHCKRDLRCCRQCKFYDPNAYNECREVSADRVVDKERGNFCDYYVPKGSQRETRHKPQEARRALEALFKKKPRK